MSRTSILSLVGSSLTALPWCCIAPAAFAVSGVAITGLGAALSSAMPLFLALSALLLGRSLYLAFVKRRGPRWVRAVVLASTPLIATAWAIRLIH